MSYANRITPGAYFGLDKINCMLAMYLMLGPCGARYSIDRLWRLRRGAPTEVPPSSAANLAIRLIQVHMCIIYLFSGIGKLQGDHVGGPARPAGSRSPMLEYQSLDMTWLVQASAAAELHDARHGVLGADVLRAGLAAAHAAVGAADGRVRPRRHHLRPGHAHVRPGDADRQPGVRLAARRSARSSTRSPGASRWPSLGKASRAGRPQTGRADVLGVERRRARNVRRYGNERACYTLHLPRVDTTYT